MNTKLLEMYSKMANLLEEQADIYSNDAVAWIVAYDSEFQIRIILSESYDGVKLIIEDIRHSDSYIEIENHNVINTIVGYAYLNGIEICKR